MRRLMFIFTALTISQVARAAVDPAATPGWEQTNKEDEFIVYTREAKGGLKEVKLVGDMSAPPSRVFAAVADLDHYKDFMPYTEESTVLARSEGEVVFYSKINAPLVSRRDYVIKLKPQPGKSENETWRSSWTLDTTHGGGKKAPTDDVVRTPLNDGAWTITPLDGGKRSHVVYYLYTNPGGSLPMWIINKANTKALPDLFAAVKKRAGAN